MERDRAVVDRGLVAALVIIVVATIARIAWALDPDIDPLSGPDSDTYHQAAIAITRLGPFSKEIPAVPYWPVGYPAFVAFLYEAFSVGTRAVGVVQALSVGVAALAVLSLHRVIGLAVAGTAAVLLSLNTALFDASGLLMYEPLLGALLAVAAALLVERRLVRSTIALGLVGVASVIQPKCLLVGLAFLAWHAWRAPKKATAICVIAFVTMPAVVSVANVGNFGSPSLSANLGATMRIGFNDEADGTYNIYSDETRRGCEEHPDLFDNDRSLTGCALSWAVRHPGRLPHLTTMKAVTFWSPFTGPYTSRGTWDMRIDLRSMYPAFWTDNETFELVDEILGNGFVVVAMVLTIVGSVGLFRRNHEVALLLTAPLVLFFLVTLGTIGDPRFRLPVAPFYVVAQAQALAMLGAALVRLSPTLRARREAQAERAPQPSWALINSKGAE